MKVYALIAAMALVAVFAACEKKETAGQKLDKATDAAKAKTEAVSDALSK